MIKANYCFVARRGLHSKTQNVPENSLKAFELAIENDFAIHFEVQLTQDNEPLVFGDEDFNRLCSLNMSPKNCPIEEASRLLLNGTEYKIPTLKETLKFIAGRVPILIEILSTGDESHIIEQKVISCLEDYHGVFAIASKNPMTVLWFKNHYPNIQRGQIVDENEIDKNTSFFKKAILKTQALNFVSSPNFIIYNIDNLKASYADDCHKKGIALLGATASTKEQLRKSKELCDGTIFEEIKVVE